ncbi:probable E3 ubiquitin-protein ligase RNF217 [Xyrichtys novacula]|uniref:E3 ubiquitin-protein ligase RNF217 n=1 Tax=Xyrichtys novacula TaxID=13765 RepID=A0AAV1GYI0_XYRNO|nr:probable E3 ubiquitin-protein ligase RNF217 [Xyrichtys novacula]
MGRTTSGMEDDEPIADACQMPSFIGGFEEGRAKLSHNLPTETSFTDGKVEQPVRDLSRGVSRSNSRVVLDGVEGRAGEKSSEEEKDAKGNNNNNCNGGGGGGGERRRASAVEILRRNFGVSKSPSLRLNRNTRMHRGTKHESTGGTFDTDSGSFNDCKRSECETGDAGTENEPTPSDLPTLDVQGVELVSITGQCRHDGDSDNKTATVADFLSDGEHIYCTVYCIANDKHRRDVEITDDDTFTSDSLETGSETGENPEPILFTLDDLVDPFADIVHHRLSTTVQADAEAAVQSCRVCLEGKTIVPLLCCGKAVCDECLKLYVSSQVRIAKSYISCPIPECSGYLDEGVVVSHLAAEDLAKYRYFLELSQLDSSIKPCPQCSHFTSLKEHNHNRAEHKYKIQCSNCQFVWCFKCHAPWHNGLKCREYRKGDKLLRTWASVIEHGQRNAQKCPQCKIHIQRTEGCDHMTCTQCSTNFCYRCGERYRHLRFFGDHSSNLSVFGCKFRYLPDKPHLRRLIRGSVCATKVLIAPVVLLLVVVLGALALVIGLVVFPVYYICKRRKKQRTQGSGRWI